MKYTPKELSTLRSKIEVHWEDEDTHRKTCSVRLCLDITVYIDNRLKPNAPGISGFYEEGLRVVRDAARHVLIDGKGRFRQVRPKDFDLLPFWLSPRCAARDVYGLVFESGETPDDMSECAFHFYRGDLNPAYLRLILPVSTIAEGAEELVSRVIAATKGLRFLSGSAGYALNVHPDYPMWMEKDHIYRISRQYTGIDLGRALFMAGFMEEGIKPPNWLTLIGEDFVKRLGGRNKLNARLPRSVISRDLPHGVMLQAGEAPRLGIVNKRETLEEYRGVWAAIRDQGIPDEVLGPYDGIGGTDNTHAWFHRFD